MKILIAFIVGIVLGADIGIVVVGLLKASKEEEV